MKAISIKNETSISTKLTAILFLIFASLFTVKSNAQISIGVSINANTKIYR